MKKRILSIVVLLSFLSGGKINATTSQFRSPISLERGVMHWPLEYPKESWWYDVMYPEDDKPRDWEVITWSGAYWRYACKAFCDRCKDSCDNSCNTCPTNSCNPCVKKSGSCCNPCNPCSTTSSSSTQCNPCCDNDNDCCNPTCFECKYPCADKSTSKTAGLATLWFGRDSFVGEEAFAGGMITDTELLTNKNPFLGFARISPQFDYNEYGAYFGMQFEKRFGKNDMWHTGFRVSLPFKVIEIEQQCCCDLEETLDDVIVERYIDVNADPGAIQVDYAYRLDFLSILAFPVPANTPVVQYGNGNNVIPDSTQIVEFPVGSTNGTAFGITVPDPGDNQAVPPVYFQRRVDGQVPCYPYRRTFEEVNGGALPAGGAGGAANDTLFFMDNTIDYRSNLGQNRDAQRELFVIPRRRTTADELYANAKDIRDRLRYVLDLLETRETAVEFFADKCIDFCKNECIQGLGNMYLQWYIGYGYYAPCDWFLNFSLGLRLPTDKRADDPKRLYYQSTGNNHHTEIELGFEGGWRPAEWFAFKIDWAYNHAFKATEFRAAPFQGACIRNIGPCVEADVSWNYFVLHTDLNFFHPKNADLGFVFGYELFAKLDDNVCLCAQTATDLLCRTNQCLDGKVLEQNTNSMTHKLRGEVFHRISFCEIFGGGSHIVGGKHAMQETELHAGIAIYF